MAPLKDLRATKDVDIQCLTKGSVLIGNWKKKYKRIIGVVREAMMSDISEEIRKEIRAGRRVKGQDACNIVFKLLKRVKEAGKARER